MGRRRGAHARRARCGSCSPLTLLSTSTAPESGANASANAAIVPSGFLRSSTLPWSNMLRNTHSSLEPERGARRAARLRGATIGKRTV